MCRPVKCRKCEKTGWAGWAGRGKHVDQVMAGVPMAGRCPGHLKEPGSGWLSKLFGL